MNPLDMMGPAFLMFYALYGVAGFVLVLLVKARQESSMGTGRWMPGRYPREDDAYHLALLRGGASLVAQALLGRLVSGGFAAVGNNTNAIARVSPDTDLQRGLLPIERKALAALPDGSPAPEVESAIEAAVRPETAAMREELVRDGLIPSEEQRAAHRRLLLATLAAIPGLGVLKLLVALARGRPNILFLILMILGYTVLTCALMRVPQRTRAGEQYLAWLRESHRGLLDQLRHDQPGGALDLALAAGIFGLAAVPQMEPVERALRPQHSAGGGSSCSSSSSGCGSGSDSGGGDGGGSDGGGSGCGGCGGGGD